MKSLNWKLQSPGRRRVGGGLRGTWNKALIGCRSDSGGSPSACNQVIRRQESHGEQGAGFYQFDGRDAQRPNVAAHVVRVIQLLLAGDHLWRHPVLKSPMEHTKIKLPKLATKQRDQRGNCKRGKWRTHGRSDGSVPASQGGGQVRGDAVVDHFDLGVFGEQNVVALDVAVHAVVAVQVDEALPRNGFRGRARRLIGLDVTSVVSRRM